MLADSWFLQEPSGPDLDFFWGGGGKTRSPSRFGSMEYFQNLDSTNSRVGSNFLNRQSNLCKTLHFQA